MKLQKYTEQQFRDAISSSVSIRQTMIKLGIVGAGGNYRTFHKAIQYFNIDISHFTGMNLTGRKLPPRRSNMEDYLSNEVAIQSNKLRKYLLDAGTFSAVCSCCNNTEWNNKPIPLELDHINGDHMDNSLNNLRLLCPNCHAQTPTYRGRNITKS